MIVQLPVGPAADWPGLDRFTVCVVVKSRPDWDSSYDRLSGVMMMEIIRGSSDRARLSRRIRTEKTADAPAGMVIPDAGDGERLGHGVSPDARMCGGEPRVAKSPPVFDMVGPLGLEPRTKGL